MTRDSRISTPEDPSCLGGLRPQAPSLALGMLPHRRRAPLTDALPDGACHDDIELSIAHRKRAQGPDRGPASRPQQRLPGRTVCSGPVVPPALVRQALAMSASVPGTPPAVLEPPRFAVTDAVLRALAEDLTPLGDLTSSLLPARGARARIITRSDGVLAGRACAIETFRQVDPGIGTEWSCTDGDRVSPGQEIAVVRGSLASVLTAERTALNFLGHLSGIATHTRRFVDAVDNASSGRTRVWDTRKTTPGLRTLEKAAVHAGGGANHRGNLSDWILLKDNHVGLIGVTGAVHAARAHWPGRTVHVECDTAEQVSEAVAAGADAILLDNMSVDAVRDCVSLAQAATTRPLLEVSGGVTLETVADYATTGVDFISAGSLTNSAPVLDVGLDMDVDAYPDTSGGT